jgi:hypothetical protein
MANWEGAARSNYVSIRDEEGLRKALKPFDITIWEKNGLFAFGGDSDSGGWPSFAYDEEDSDDEVEFDPATQICPFMAEDSVLVMMQSGHEKLRYVDGRAEAYNSAGEYVSISITQIYEIAKEKFGIEPTAAEY